jgi:N-acetylglucosamine-6-phosphate deacetylase
MSAPVVIRGRLVLADRVVPGRVVVMDRTIDRVELDDAESGPYVCPGLVDVHIHGYGGFDSMDGPVALDGMARALLRHGVTAFVPTAVTTPLATLRRFVDDVRAWQRRALADGAQPLGFNLEGPSSNRTGRAPRTRSTSVHRRTSREPSWNRCSMAGVW